MEASKRIKLMVGGGIAAGAMLLSGPAVLANATPVMGGDIAIRGGGAFANGDAGGAFSRGEAGGGYATGNAGGGYATGEAGGKWFRDFKAECEANPTICGGVAPEVPATP